MKRVIIMRGLPGSGKSTEAKSYILTHGAAVVSADDFFMVNGEYRFDASKLGDAHTACMRLFLDLLNNGVEPVVVDNTNVRLSELTPYRLVALAHGYSVEVVRLKCSPQICAERNTHGVPLPSIVRMSNSFEDMPGFLGGERIVDNDSK